MSHPQLLQHQYMGVQDYTQTWQAMRDFTQLRQAHTTDELWLVQHPATYTQGQAGKAEHLLLNPHSIPVVNSDRGGQVTYHGPGQLLAYLLLDLRRLGVNVRKVVNALEGAVISLLTEWGIDAAAKQSAPGVYVDQRKIASLGLRVRRGCCYHGVALNVDMDLQPFAAINPCGYAGMKMTQLRDFTAGQTPPIEAVAARFAQHLAQALDMHLQGPMIESTSESQ